MKYKNSETTEVDISKYELNTMGSEKTQNFSMKKTTSKQKKEITKRLKNLYNNQ